MARIYISSTFSDLAEARGAVYRALRKLRHDVIAMEDYIATDQRPVDKCLSDVASCDVYVGLFAWRYGYIPPQQEQSITELEFREAVRKGIPCLLFLLHDDAPWPPKQTDDDRSRIRALREECCRDRTVSFFHTVEELASLVSIAVTNLQTSTAPDTELTTNNAAPGLGLQYASIKVCRDNEFWINGDQNPWRGDAVYPTRIFDWQWRYECDLKVDARPEDADPSLDITLFNNSTEPLLLTGIGIEVVSIGNLSFSGASIPQARKVLVAEKYTIEIPDLMPLFMEERRKQDLALDLELHVNAVAWGQMVDPVYVEARAPYRYEVLLKSFGRRVPRLTLLRLLTETSSGQVRSENILFRRWM
jgi:hypothetical protein